MEEELGRIYDNIPELQKIGSKGQFIEAMGDPQTAGKIYDNVPTISNIGSKEQFLEFVTVPNAKSISQEPQKEEQFLDGPLGKIDFIDDIARSFSSGRTDARLIDKAEDVATFGATDDEISEFVKALKNQQELPQSDEFRDFSRIVEEGGGGVGATIKGLVKNPTVGFEIFARSLSSMFNKEAGKAGILGAGTAGLAGTAVPVVGNVIGAGGGFIAGVSAATDGFLTFSELIGEEIDGEITDEKVKAVLEDPGKISRIKRKSIARGLTIGIIDGLTLGIAANVGAKVATRTGSKVATVAATGGVESIGGGAGEFGGQIAAGQDTNSSEIFLEMAIGNATLPLSVGSALIKNKFNTGSTKINGELVDQKLVGEIIDEAESVDELEGIQIENNKELEDKLSRKFDELSIKSELPTGISEDVSNKIVELEKELRGLSDPKTETANIRKKAIKEQISELLNNQENAETKENGSEANETQVNQQEDGEGKSNSQQVPQNEEVAETTKEADRETISEEVDQESTQGEIVAPEASNQTRVRFKEELKSILTNFDEQALSNQDLANILNDRNFDNQELNEVLSEFNDSDKTDADKDLFNQKIRGISVNNRTKLSEKELIDTNSLADEINKEQISPRTGEEGQGVFEKAKAFIKKGDASATRDSDGVSRDSDDIKLREQGALRILVDKSPELFIPISELPPVVIKEDGKRAGGSENDIRIDEDTGEFIKVNNTSLNNSMKEFIDRIDLHNQFESNAPYEFLGFTEKDGKINPVLSQPPIKGVAATEAEIDAELQKRGFQKQEGDPSNPRFINDQGVVVDDVYKIKGDNPNVIKTEDGDIIFIDPNIITIDESNTETNTGNRDNDGGGVDNTTPGNDSESQDGGANVPIVQPTKKGVSKPKVSKSNTKPTRQDRLEKLITSGKPINESIVELFQQDNSGKIPTVDELLEMASELDIKKPNIRLPKDSALIIDDATGYPKLLVPEGIEVDQNSFGEEVIISNENGEVIFSPRVDIAEVNAKVKAIVEANKDIVNNKDC